MTDYTILTEDNLLEITDRLDDQSLLTYCQTNKEIAALCRHKVWLHRIFTNGLEPLLPQAVLYPSLREFYLNIRHDALYEVAIDHVENRTHLMSNNYHVNVKDVYDNIKIPRDSTYVAVILRITNNKYGIGYHNTYTPSQRYKGEQSFLTSFEEILKFPNLEPRPLIMINGLGYTSVTTNNLRDRHNNKALVESTYMRTVGRIHDIDAQFNKFKWGFYQSERPNVNQQLILLDNSLIDQADGVKSVDNNYYAVVVPVRTANGRIYEEFKPVRPNNKANYSPFLLNHIVNYGTFYKIEDLPAVMRQLL